MNGSKSIKLVSLNVVFLGVLIIDTNLNWKKYIEKISNVVKKKWNLKQIETVVMEQVLDCLQWKKYLTKTDIME